MTNSVKKGVLFVISGPSGVGKGTLVNLLKEKHPEITLSVSATTRKPRWNEANGLHYYFLERDEFENRVKEGEFLEWAEFSGNLYGTSRRFVEQMLNEGLNVLLEIDVQGALQVKNKIPEAILIFIEPPSLEELQNRLFRRKTDSESEIQNRLAVVKNELSCETDFNYVIINDTLNDAYSKLENAVNSELEKVKS